MRVKLIKDVMKKLYFIAIMGLVMACGGAKDPQMVALKQEKESLKLQTKLNSLQISLQKEKKELEKAQQNVNSLNNKADNRTTGFSASGDAQHTAKDAQRTAKVLEQTRKANNQLYKVQKKVDKLEREISNVQNKLTAYQTEEK